MNQIEFSNSESILNLGGTCFRTSDLFDCNNIPVIAFPSVNHDDNQHAANENLRLQNLWDAIGVFAAFFSSLESAKD